MDRSTGNFGEQPTDLQQGNRAWWTRNTMSYDWKNKVPLERFSREWFDEIDERFISTHTFAHENGPFDRLIPFQTLAGKSVLEIGCGMGFHSSLLSKAGADLHSIDISPTSVEATRRRFDLFGLKGQIGERDAETLTEKEAYDLVWSWGVIHHSSRTAFTLARIYESLKPGGEARMMVYNRDGMQAYSVLVTKYLFGFWRGRTFDEYLWQSTDGYIARYYARDQLSDLARMHSSDVSIDVYGLESDAVPLPRHLRKFASKMVSHSYKQRAIRQRGSFLFLRIRKPV